MKKYFTLLLALVLCLALFTACGDKNAVTDEASASEKKQATVSAESLPAVDSELVTDEDYQVFSLDENTTVFQINGAFSQRMPLFTPAGGSLTFQLQLTNSNERAKAFTLALWESDGVSMTYTDTYYIPADGKTYTCTFENLTGASYRPILSVDKGDATGRIAVTGGGLTSNQPVIEEEEAEA